MKKFYVNIGRVPVLICILGTIHIVQGQAGYIYNKPNEPVNEGFVGTVSGSTGVQPGTTRRPDVFNELGGDEDSVPGEHLSGHTLGNEGYHPDKTASFQVGFQEDSRQQTSQEPSQYPVHSENSLPQTTSTGYSGKPASPSEEPRPHGYHVNINSFNPPGTKPQGQLLPSSKDSNGFNGNQVQNTYTTNQAGIQNHGLTTSGQYESTESSLLPTGQYVTAISDSFTTGNEGSTGFLGSQQEGFRHTNFGSTQGHHYNGDLGLSYGSGSESDDESYEGGDYSAIPGEPGVDYPIFSDIPQTSFRCQDQQWPGYYADVEARCQVFHICTNSSMYDFLCPNGTIFSQEYFVCVWWNQFDCNNAHNYFYLNEKIYDYTITGSKLAEGNFPGFPGVNPPGTAPLGGPLVPSSSLPGYNIPLQQPNGPLGPSTPFQSSAGPHGSTEPLTPTESLGPALIPQGPGGSYESSPAPQGPSVLLQPSSGPSGPVPSFGSTALFPGPPSGSVIPQRPYMAFYPSTGPYSQNAPFGQSNPTGPTGSFELNKPLGQSNGPLGPSPSYEPSTGPQGHTAVHGSGGTPYQPSAGPSGQNNPARQPNEPSESTSHGPSTSFQPSAGTLGSTGPVGHSDSFSSTPGSQGPSGSFQSSVPQEPSTSFQHPSGPNSNNAPLGGSYGSAGTTASFGPNGPLAQSNGPFGPLVQHESSSGGQGPTVSYGSGETSYGPGSSTAIFPGPSGSYESPAVPQKPSTEPYKYNTPLGPLFGPGSTTSIESNEPLRQPNRPIEPITSYSPNAPSAQSNERFGSSVQHEPSSGAHGPTGGPTPSFSGPSGPFESSVVHQGPSFQPSSGVNGENAPLGQSYGPARPDAPFGPSAPHELSSGIQGSTESYGSTETHNGSGGPTTSFPRLDGPFETSAPQKTIHQPSTGPYRYNEPIKPLTGPTYNEPSTPLGPPNVPSASPRPSTFQSFTGPSGQNTPPSFQLPVGQQKPTGHQGLSGSFELSSVPQESTSYQPSTGAFNPSNTYGEPQVPTGSGPSRPQGTLIQENPTPSTTYSDSKPLLDTSRPGGQNSHQDQQGQLYPSGTPDISGLQQIPLHSGPMLNNQYLPPYHPGS